MTEIRLALTELKASPSNVRPKHTKEDIDMMAKSIGFRGLINPPAVAKNGDGKYEVIAGNLRVAGARKAGIEEIRCLDVTAFTDSERVELSLSENVDRKEMTVMQRYSAYDKLFKAGMPVEKIGERFSKTENEVQQLLAIGSLPKKILDAYDNEEVGDRTIQALAIAPGKDLVRYMKLKPKDRPNDWDTATWLAGEKGKFLETKAIFDLELYVGPRIIDMFNDDEVWLTDGDQFMDLQIKAMDDKLTAFNNKGWQVEQVDYWQSWAYNKTAKAKGGKVFWCRSDKTGEVEFHVGYERADKTGKAPKAKGSDGKPEAQPEISQAFQAYMTQVRHNGVRGELLDDSKAALVVVICGMLRNHDSFRMDSIDMGSVKGEAYETDIAAGVDYAAMEEAFVKISKDSNPAKLYTMTVPALLDRLAAITAWRWQVYGSEFSNDIAKAIGLVDVQNWQPTETFWNGIKNKTTLTAIAKELKIEHLKDAPATAIRKLLILKVKANGWRPKWLKF
jgi:ParB/RepB/Spo0J family partition protein